MQKKKSFCKQARKTNKNSETQTAVWWLLEKREVGVVKGKEDQSR